MEKFDYGKALETLEEILKKVEDPATGVDDIDKYVSMTEQITSRCREYLRSVRETVNVIGKENGQGKDDF